MKSLSLIVLVATAVGASALAGCSSCTPPEETKKAATPVTCGQGTVAQGSTCVGRTGTR